ncbi:tRNA (adenosine(37)-N6)-threonylcarbamoyltransferase complex ATPase subunit type 1 TsaE [Undibacterium fentianense]|uniref:tRNA threonylcarbamoyladenosine biosynthesis protein TsaE n=1 Tax=Undibacterium fentianense TaxID=2828728 RepID=A0A941DZ37_9BURK|nr:tRNA (adenosine(37)-N6)-threonylcarbamoyltransferase complex ATPase subunit type 1 TsaE [Undibacterium fentianense]MBR7799415.1 tRNA (adenosine(37)-N6)-threonylcarbamoyltransferase complex ATPase subunit type 1 TsaE [Undibacterium fentianense]
MQHYKTSLADEAATLALGKSFAHCLRAGLIIYLNGDLGAGKTALTRAILHASGYVGTVKSPTYTLAEPYQISVQGNRIKLMHFDLYRLRSPDEFTEAGFRDEINTETICIIEWPDKADGVLPLPDIQIDITILDEGRDVDIRAHTDKGESSLSQLRFAPNL